MSGIFILSLERINSRRYPISTTDQGIGSESGVGSEVLRCDSPLLLREGLNADSTLYM